MKEKKPRPKRLPRTRCSGTMTESAYWSFIRSCLRAKSRRWKPIYDCLNSVRRESKSKSNKRLKWEYQCNACKEWFAQKEVTVDHIRPAGSLKSSKDLEGFVERLFCERDGLQVLCEPCHQEKTNRERNDS